MRHDDALRVKPVFHPCPDFPLYPPLILYMAFDCDPNDHRVRLKSAYIHDVSFAGNPVEALKDYKIGTLTQASGGLCVFAILLAVVNRIFPSADGMGALTRAAIGFDSEEKEA